MKTISIFLLASFVMLSACTDEEITNLDGTPIPPGGDDSNNQSSWLIPQNEVRDGGPGKDGIPAITGSDFGSPGEVNYLSDDDLVLGFVDGNDVRAYPHSILDWHEIINDNTENHSLAVIYCPLTGTGIGWDRVLDGKETTFGVSGLLYNTNIIPYDRETDSNWSQLLLKSVNGKLKGTTAKTYNLFETTWKTWKQMYPSTKVVTMQTGYNRNYGRYPYGSYKTSDNLIFPISNNDPRLKPKERVLGVIIDEKAKAYKFDKTASGNKVIGDSFQGTKLVVIKNANANFIVAFKRVLPDGTELGFEAVQNQLPVILKDNEGTTWDVFGRGISGPRAGAQLETVPQMMGYWFAFPAFYPDLEIK
jgi:hypothetical protein